MLLLFYFYHGKQIYVNQYINQVGSSEVLPLNIYNLYCFMFFNIIKLKIKIWQ